MNCKELHKNAKIQEWQTKFIAQREETADLREKVAKLSRGGEQTGKTKTNFEAAKDTLVQRQAQLSAMQQSSELLQRLVEVQTKNKDNAGLTQEVSMLRAQLESTGQGVATTISTIWKAPSHSQGCHLQPHHRQ
eukprot:TRINITY_DN67854_c0_g1_i1.p3 TRINITY_DN67854_c0_g1~~TRINITY_DN67854_c0_g1_i1.p3  ORF type:complete len:134 (-),score=19.91 TRINITY_DN67854_c0_g1_i1:1627-2028(-)